MEITLLITVFHILGVAFGVGGATVSDVLFFRTIADKRISRDELALLHTLSYVVWAGLIILLVSGLGFVVTQYVETGTSTYLVSAWFLAKMTIVFLLFCNAFVMHTVVFPFLQANVDTKLTGPRVRSKRVVLATTGVVSIVSWYSAMVLGVTRGLDLPYLFIINLYLVLLFGGIFIAYFLFAVVMFPTKVGAGKVGQKALVHKPARLRRAGLAALTIFFGIILISLAWYAPKFAGFSKSVSTTHFVCITETAPWFSPEVLSIEVGDAVTWVHCAEGESGNDYMEEDARTSHLVPGTIAFAHGDDDHSQTGPSAHVHTHPILSLSGPERFGSELRPVGHLADGNEYSFTFTQAGIYEYICPTHPYMKGVIAVGEESPVASLWPPADEKIDPSIGLPPTPGIGEVWVNTQFEVIDGQPYPGSITVIDAQTWQISEVITDLSFNNPHNLWGSPDGALIYQTQWHSDALSIIDARTKEVLRTLTLGNAPAHVFTHPHDGRVFVSMNNENRVAVLDREGRHQRDLIMPVGPHGLWISPDGTHLSVASTLNEKLTVFDLTTETIREVFELPGLPLATAITHDGRYAMGSSLLDGFVRFIDLETLAIAADVHVGEMPIWPSPAPDGRHVFVPNSGSADVSVIDLSTMSVVATIPTAAGAHGIIFGPKEGGGHYGYVSHKFARVVSVIDPDSFTLVGYIPLGETAWGGNGILAIPGAYDEKR